MENFCQRFRPGVVGWKFWIWARSLPIYPYLGTCERPIPWIRNAEEPTSSGTYFLNGSSSRSPSFGTRRHTSIPGLAFPLVLRWLVAWGRSFDLRSHFSTRSQVIPDLGRHIVSAAASAVGCPPLMSSKEPLCKHGPECVWMKEVLPFPSGPLPIQLPRWLVGSF